MDNRESFDLLIRNAVQHSDTEEMYRVTLFRKIQSIDELFLHPEIARLIEGRVVRVERIDNYRFKVFLRKN